MNPEAAEAPHLVNDLVDLVHRHRLVLRSGVF
jgi:hypothetical protein